MDTANTITDTVVALREESGKIYAVTWDADKSLTVWQVEGASGFDVELGRWFKVKDCDATEAPRSLNEASQLAAAILTAHLEHRTVFVATTV